MIQRGVRNMGAVADANRGIYLQAFSVQGQLSNEALRLLNPAPVFHPAWGSRPRHPARL